MFKKFFLLSLCLFFWMGISEELNLDANLNCQAVFEIGFNQSSAINKKVKLKKDQASQKPTSHERHSVATAFAVGPQSVVTFRRAMTELVSNQKNFEEISLYQGADTFEIEGVSAWSVDSDFILLKTREELPSYLSLTEKPLKNEDTNLNVVGYVKDQGVVVMNVLGSMLINSNKLSFPINKSNVKGAFGSPVLDSEGHVVGVLIASESNYVTALSSHLLKDFLEDNKESVCKTQSLEECFVDIRQKSIPISEKDFFDWFWSRHTVSDMDFVKMVSSRARQGDAFFQYEWAKILRNGYKNVVKQDFSQAYKWAEESAKQSYLPALYLKALMIEEGLGVYKNKEQAQAYKEQLAKEGYVPAQEDVGFYFLKQDETQKPHWLRASAQNGSVSSQAYIKTLNQFVNHIAEIFLGVESPDRLGNGKLSSQRNKEEYLAHFRDPKEILGEFTDKNDSYSFHILGLKFWHGDKKHFPKNREKAIGLFKTAADLGDAESQFVLGLIYFLGKGVPKSKEQALYWLERAFDNGWSFYGVEHLMLMVRAM